MKIGYSYLDKQFANPDPILADIKQVVLKGDFTLGEAVSEFETRFAKLIGSKYAIGVGSGTDALFLSLKALGIGEGDEVITATNTFVATAGAIETAGAKIVFVDCNDKYVIDTDQIEKAITSKTKAILPVHFSGQPANMNEILRIANKHGLKVVEDACCAIDAEIDGQRCGTIGDLAGFSLHPLKNLNVWGDGGVITTNSIELYEQIKLMRNHGMVDRDTYAFYSYNSRLDTVHAVVGNHLIDDVKWITEQRIKNANTIDHAFLNTELREFINLPERSSSERNVYHMYMFLAKDRDQLHKHLINCGISAKIHYPTPLHLQPASLKLGYKLGDFPLAEKQAKSIITLPVHQHLEDSEVQYMIEKVREFYLGGS